jgi:uncharacterized membrane protein
VRSRVILPPAALLAATAWCLLLIAVRKYEFGAAQYRYLVWNLALAWIPMLFALLLVAAYRLRRSALELVALGGAWLLFLPNAPYILTDFIHLGPDHRMYDTLLVGSFAFTGLALGFVSLLLVQLVVTRAGGALLGWAVALGSLFFASVGIYLGRIIRLNSWDAVQRPHRLLQLARLRLEDPFGNRYLIGFVILFCCFLTLAYAGFYGFTALVASVRADDRPGG